MEISVAEASRLATLVKYNILDSAAEEPFDRLAEIAADVFHAPIALISLVDGSRQWFKSRVGLTASEMPRDWAFCARTIQGDDVYVVPDTSKARSLGRTPPGEAPIRFYAGAPLRTAEGHTLGTLCILDRRARRGFSARDKRLLQQLADMVMVQIELRRTLRQLNSSVQKAHRLAARAGAARKPAAAKRDEQIAAECQKALRSLAALAGLGQRPTRQRDRVITPDDDLKPSPQRRLGDQTVKPGARRRLDRRVRASA